LTIQINENMKKLLQNDEEVLWQGQPNIKKKFTKSDIFLIPFSIIWFGMFIFFTIWHSNTITFSSNGYVHHFWPIYI
jgi:hypothetical protein